MRAERNGDGELRRRLLRAAGLDDLWQRAAYSRRLEREDLLRVVACPNPLAAAALGDVRRAALHGDVTTFTVAARMRGPDAPEPGVFVRHDVGDLDGLDADELLVLHDPESDELDDVLLRLRAAKAARPDLPLRALDADTVARFAETVGGLDPVASALAEAGLDVLGWIAGGTFRPAVQRALHTAGVATYATVPYHAGEVDETFVDRLLSVREAVAEGGPWVAALPLPDTTYAADPLAATAGTEDVLACALVRLAFGHELLRVSVDAHLVGHKQAAMLLDAGADDVLGAQAGRDWTIPENDAPRPLNEARVRRYVEECRRVPIRRAGLGERATT